MGKEATIWFLSVIHFTSFCLLNHLLPLKEQEKQNKHILGSEDWGPQGPL